MQTHDLKTWPAYFQPLVDGIKTFECRLNDRDYRVGDVLFLREWNPETMQYTGRHTYRVVAYILDEALGGLQPGYVVMGFSDDHRSRFAIERSPRA